MGDFEKACKALNYPICPGCGELRQLEQLNSLVWRCDVCTRQWEHKAPKPLTQLEQP